MSISIEEDDKSPAAPSPQKSFIIVENAEGQPASKEINWDGDQDKLNPINWNPRKKWLILGIISTMTFITPLSSSMFAPGVEQVMEEFHFSNTDLATLVVSIYVLGFAIGPLIIAPLSEINGRRLVYLISNFFFLLFTIGCALSSNLGMLFAFRFLAGCAGSTPVTLGGASIGDMFPKESRGAAMAVWGMGPILGPVLGPVIGGFLAQGKGWRWTFWLQAIVSGTTLLLGTAFLRETYAVTILEHKTQRLIRETGDRDLVSALRDGTPGKEHFKRAFIRPVKMLLLSPIVLLLSLYMALIFGYLYLFLTTFPTVFQEQYGFSTGVTGLSYLGVGIGSFVGLVIAGKSSDPLYVRLTAKNHGVGHPEFRLPPLMFTCPLIVIAFFWYGWSVETKTHWIVPIIGTSLFGMGMIPAFLVINMYLVDAYTRYAASAIAASRVLQSIVGAFLPLAGQPMYERLGLGWGNSVLGFIALVFVPVPWLFFTYGEQLRTRYPVKL